MIRSYLALVAFCAGSLLFAGCGSDDITCGIPFSTLPCSCEGGETGSYLCGPDGIWGPCSCEGTTADAGSDPTTDVPEADAVTDAGTDTEPDTPICEPNCGARECGDDGCAGTCGECVDNDSCVDGFCECVPNCVERECGDDGCGGSCGECPSAAHSCQGSGDVRECSLAAAGDYGDGILRTSISPAGCSFGVSLVVEDDGRIIFTDSIAAGNMRCESEFERQPLAVQIEFPEGTPRVQAPANVDVPVFVRIEWAGRGSGFDARLEGTFPIGENAFEGRLTGLPQTANVNGRDFRMSSAEFTFPWP